MNYNTTMKVRPQDNMKVKNDQSQKQISQKQFNKNAIAADIFAGNDLKKYQYLPDKASIQFQNKSNNVKKYQKKQDRFAEFENEMKRAEAQRQNEITQLKNQCVGPQNQCRTLTDQEQAVLKVQELQIQVNFHHYLQEKWIEELQSNPDAIVYFDMLNVKKEDIRQGDFSFRYGILENALAKCEEHIDCLVNKVREFGFEDKFVNYMSTPVATTQQDPKPKNQKNKTGNSRSQKEKLPQKENKIEKLTQGDIRKQIIAQRMPTNDKINVLHKLFQGKTAKQFLNLA